MEQHYPRQSLAHGRALWHHWPMFVHLDYLDIIRPCSCTSTTWTSLAYARAHGHHWHMDIMGFFRETFSFHSFHACSTTIMARCVCRLGLVVGLCLSRWGALAPWLHVGRSLHFVVHFISLRLLLHQEKKHSRKPWFGIVAVQVVVQQGMLHVVICFVHVSCQVKGVYDAHHVPCYGLCSQWVSNAIVIYKTRLCVFEVWYARITTSVSQVSCVSYARVMYIVASVYIALYVHKFPLPIHTLTWYNVSDMWIIMFDSCTCHVFYVNVSCICFMRVICMYHVCNIRIMCIIWIMCVMFVICIILIRCIM